MLRSFKQELVKIMKWNQIFWNTQFAQLAGCNSAEG